jgi:integrase
MPQLTDDYIETLAPPESGYTIHWDGDFKKAVPGFGLRLTANGAKTFVFNYRTRTGRQRRIKIGYYPAYSVTAARKVASQHYLAVTNGGDPMADVQSERDSPTMAKLCDFYIENHLPTKRKAPAKTDKYAIDRIILPKLKHHKLADIKPSDIKRIHRDITKTGKPFRANRIVALLHTMFELAKDEGWVDRNPCKSVKRNPEPPRERYLSVDELNRLTEALAAYPDQNLANAVRLLLLTGARRGEVLGMEWEQINFEERTWTKPSAHTKQNKTHHIPLSAPALQLLSEMRERADEDAKFVFPGEGKTGHRIDLKKPWKAIHTSAKIANLRLHDLRHSYASILASGGTSIPILMKLLGHTQISTTMRYAHLSVDPLREQTERVGAVVTGAGKPSAEVTKFKRNG